MTTPRISRPMAARAALLVLAAAVPAAAQRVEKDPAPAGADTAYYVVTAGRDTIAIETVVRRRDRLDGDLRILPPRSAAIQYTLFTRPDATADSLHTTQVTGTVAARGTITFARDSAVLRMEAPGLTAARVDHIATGPGALPFINLSSGVLEQVFRRARVVGGGQVAVPLVAGPQLLPGVVRFIGADSAVLALNVELRAAVGPDGRLHGATVPAQNVRFARTSAKPVASAAAAVPAATRYAAPAGAPYRATHVTVPGPGGIALAGTLTLPNWASPERPAPVVVTISGSGPQNRDSELPGMAGYAIFRQVADTLGRRGLGVLRLDDRGVGESQDGPAAPTSADFADDVRAAVRWLRARADVDSLRIGLLGHSEGGLIAPMVAAEDATVRAVALLAAPSRRGREISAHQRQLAIAHDSTVPEAARDSVFRLRQAELDSTLAAGGGDAWTRFWWSFDPVPTARRVRVPVLILHGATDMQVPVAQGEELAARLRESGNRDVTFRSVAGVNHLFLEDPSGHWSGYAALPSRTVPAVIMGTLADWFAGRLAAPPQR